MTIDIDGTLTRVHGWKVISEALGRTAEYERTQRRFFAHEIGEDEHLANLLRIAEGVPLARVEAALESTPRLAHLREGIGALHDRGSRVALLTHNPPYVCDWYRRRFGFDDFEGTGSQPVVDGVIGPPGEVHADKPDGLARLLARTALPARAVVHVGDGWADAAVFPLVGAGVALNTHLPEVARAADLVLRSADFREVVERVEALPPRR